MPTPLFSNSFFHEGRGPELQAVHWSHGGRVLAAIDYFNPDWAGPEDLHHVRFQGVQIVMRTPHEVVGAGWLGACYASQRPAAMFDLGSSPWLLQFSTRHLADCRHVQLMFYDEVFDVICERVECFRGGYLKPGGTTTESPT